jgi:hypothetical protein
MKYTPFTPPTNRLRFGSVGVLTALLLSACGGVNVSVATPTVTAPQAAAVASTATPAEKPAEKATPPPVEKPTEPVIKATSTAEPAAAAPTKPAPTAGPIGAGIAYVVGQTGRVSQLKDGAWSAPAQLNVITNCPEGQFIVNDKNTLALCSISLFKLTASGAWQEYKEGFYGAKALDAKGDIWDLEPKQLKVLRADGSLDAFKPDVIKAEKFPDANLYVAPNGALWMSGWAESADSPTVAMYDGKTWQAFARKDFTDKEGKVPDYLSINKIFQTSSGDVLALASNGIFALDDGKFVLRHSANEADFGICRC